MGQDLYRLHDLGDPRWRILDLKLGHVIEKAIEIVKYLGRELDVSHAPVQRCGVRATGLRGRSPRDRASSQAFASSHPTVFPVDSTFAQRSSATRWKAASS